MPAHSLHLNACSVWICYRNFLMFCTFRRPCGARSGALAAPTWIVEQHLSQPISRQILAARLGAGESEAIALALEVTPRYVLLDDLAARRLAQSFNLSVLGTVGLLLLARQRNLLPALRPSGCSVSSRFPHFRGAL